jgi:hypothetical protein
MMGIRVVLVAAVVGVSSLVLASRTARAGAAVPPTVRNGIH